MRDEELPFEWFERDDYPRILEVMSDTHRLPRAFEEWEKHALAGVQELEATRYSVVRTVIKPDVFANWCRDNGFQPNAQGRLKYCKQQLRNAAVPSNEDSGLSNPEASEPTATLRPEAAAPDETSIIEDPVQFIGKKSSRLLDTGKSAWGALRRLLARPRA